MIKHAKTCKNMQKHENIYEGVRGVNLKNLLNKFGWHLT